MALATDHLADLIQALLDEERARGEVRAAVHQQATALRELRGLGLPPSAVAHKVATARGLVLDLPDRLRLAARLRKRRWRGTRCPAEVSLSHGPPPSATPISTWATPPDHQESNMPRIVKKTTVTEEYLDEPDKPDEDQDEVDEDVDAADDAEEDPEGDAEAPRKRRRR